MPPTNAIRPNGSPGWTSLLLRLRLPHHRRAAADDLLHPDVEGEVAVLGKARRRGLIAERQLGRHGETIFATLLHPRHRLGESGEDLAHREGLRAAMVLAAVEHRAVVERADIVHQRRVFRL